jgi:hypothetical protein
VNVDGPGIDRMTKHSLALICAACFALPLAACSEAPSAEQAAPEADSDRIAEARCGEADANDRSEIGPDYLPLDQICA